MNEKLKVEKYQGLQGINAKFSPYISGLYEFLDIQNLDFQMPGALTQRWGSTMYFGQTLSGKITALTEFGRLSGASYIIYGSTGALYSGTSTGTNQGVSFINFNQGNGFGHQNTASMYDVIWNGATSVFVAAGVPYLGDFSRLTSPSYDFRVAAQTLGVNNLSSAVLNNYLFAANGQQLYRFDGVTASLVGSPPVTVTSNSIFIVSPNSVEICLGVTGSYAFYGSFVNDRGFEGQIWPMAAVNLTRINGVTLGGASYMHVSVKVNLPNYNIQSLNVYSYWSSSATLSFNGVTTAWSGLNYVLTGNFPIAGASIITEGGVTLMHLRLGSTIGGQTALQVNGGPLPDAVVNSYYPIGFTAVHGSTQFGLQYLQRFDINAVYPQYVSAYQNRLFLAGFSSMPSTVVFSDIAEPEGYPLENNFEIRTNDGDVLTGQVPYAQRMYFFKRKSFHVLSGDSVANYQLQAVSLQYGALNSKCITVFGEDEILAFLDRKGIIFFNGARPTHASIKMQPYFDRMNYAAALSEACMVHDKIRNQIICGIPIDGSSVNNIQIIYDYVSNNWTTATGSMPSIMTRIQGRNTAENVFYGSYSGVVQWYGSSFTSDNGTGFTCYLKTRFDHEMGDTVQKQFRRLFVNMDPPSVTLNIPVNFFQDYGASKVLQSTFTIGEFQNRLEYGISAKAVAFEMYHAAQTVPIRIYGYSLEERMQRKV